MGQYVSLTVEGFVDSPEGSVTFDKTKRQKKVLQHLSQSLRQCGLKMGTR